MPLKRLQIICLERNKELSKRNSQNLKYSRTQATQSIETLRQYFSHLEESIKDFPAENMINYDETNLTDDPGREKVIVRRKSKRAHRLMDTSKTSTSVMICVTAARELLSPYIVYKAKYLYPDWTEGGPRGTRYNRSKSGWFDSDIFEDWFNSVALPYLRRLEGRKVICDNLGSHLSFHVIQ